MEGEDRVHSTKIEETMIEIEVDHRTEIEEKEEKEEIIKEHHDQSQTLVLGTVHRIDIIDQPQEEDTIETLQEEDTIETLQEEDIIETIPQIDMIDLAPEEDTSLSTHPPIKNDQKVGQEMGQGKKGMIVGGKTDIEA